MSKSEPWLAFCICMGLKKFLELAQVLKIRADIQETNPYKGCFLLCKAAFISPQKMSEKSDIWPRLTT
jgi:hypothetical protein